MKRCQTILLLFLPLRCVGAMLMSILSNHLIRFNLDVLATGYFYPMVKLYLKMSAIAATARAPRPNRKAVPKPEKKERVPREPKAKASTSKGTSKATLTKAIQTAFTKNTNLQLIPITELEEYEGNEKLFTVNDKITFHAYIQDDENIMFVQVLGKGQEFESSSYYSEKLTESDLFRQVNILWKVKNIYFLFLKNVKDDKNGIQCYHYDLELNEADEIEQVEDFSFAKLKQIFKAEEFTINDGMKVLRPIYDDQRTTSGLQSGQRIPFNIITWVMLKNNDIPFKTLSDGRKYSLREWLELKDYHVKHSTPKERETEEWKRNQKVFDETNPVDLVKSFENVLKSKMQKNADAKFQSMFKNQIKVLETKLVALYNTEMEEQSLHIANKIYSEIFLKNPNLDMNKLAFECESHYMKKTNEIYTHQMIKDLVIKLFSQNIEDGATCYDPTCGTGGFTKSFYQFCEKNDDIKNIIAYGNEIEENASNMAWLDGLVSSSDVRVFHFDCFNPIIKHELIEPNSIEFLLMNPPYGMNSSDETEKLFPKGFDWHEDRRMGKDVKKTEWTFCRYNMESFSKPGGWFAFVIPTSCVSENKQNWYDKNEMIQKCEIWFVIKLREDIFKPQASKSACVVIGRYLNGKRTAEQIKTWKTKCVDFTDDGGRRHGGGEVEYKRKALEKLWNERIFDNKDLTGLCQNKDIKHLSPQLDSLSYITNEEGEPYYVEKVLTPEDDWVFTKRDELDMSEQFKPFHEAIERRRNEFSNKVIGLTDFKSLYKEDDSIKNNCEWRDVKIDELFEYIGRGKRTASTDSKGAYPLISARNNHNGICDYIDEFDYDGTYMTVANQGNGGAGYCFVQEGKFACVSTVSILRLKDEYDYLDIDQLIKIGFIMTAVLKRLFSHSRGATQERIMCDFIALPFNPETNEIDFSTTNMFSTNIDPVE